MGELMGKRLIKLLSLFVVFPSLVMPYTILFNPKQVLAASSYNWYPGYYVLAAGSVSPDAKRRLMDDPLTTPFTGYQFRYNWADSELSPGNYSAGFAAVDADLAQVASR